MRYLAKLPMNQLIKMCKHFNCSVNEIEKRYSSVVVKAWIKKNEKVTTKLQLDLWQRNVLPDKPDDGVPI